MASSSSKEVEESGSNRKKLPESIYDLLDVAIFSFGCQVGLRSNHKIRGDPVLEGVIAFFGYLLQCSKPQTQKDFESIYISRLGGWSPGCDPKEMLMLVSSRIKTQKSKGDIRENANPVVPKSLADTKMVFSTENEHVKTFVYSKCWRCNLRCEFCRNRNKHFPDFGNFRVE